MFGENHSPKRQPNAAWSWDMVRRNRDYRDYYFGSQSILPKTVSLSTGSTLLRANRRYLEAEKWGLLFPAHPDKSAAEANVMWRPDWLSGTINIKLSKVLEGDIPPDNPHDIIVISAMLSRRIMYDAVDGTRHILLNGSRFWIQLQCAPPVPIGDEAAVLIEMEGATHGMRRLDSIRQLFALHRSTGGRLSLIGRRKNATPLANALSAYDIWHGFERARGGLKEIAEMINGPKRIEADWNTDNRALMQQAKRARDKGEALVAGGYRELLVKKTL